MKTLQKKPICLVRPRKKRKSTFLKISLPYFSSPGLQGHGWRISCHVERNTVLFSPCLLTVAITAIRAASQAWWWWGRGQEDFLLPQFAPAEDGLTFSTEDCTQTFAISCLAREQWAQTFSLFSFSPSPSLSPPRYSLHPFQNRTTGDVPKSFGTILVQGVGEVHVMGGSSKESVKRTSNNVLNLIEYLAPLQNILFLGSPWLDEHWCHWGWLHWSWVSTTII